MHSTYIIPTTEQLYHDKAYDAEYKVFEQWERWYFGLRAGLHWTVNEELSGADLLDDFFDAYGLAFEAHYGNPILIDFLGSEPTRPEDRNSPSYRAPSELMARVEAAANLKPVEYPTAKLPEVAAALRERAEALAKLADQIDRGEFRFPSW